MLGNFEHRTPIWLRIFFSIYNLSKSTNLTFYVPFTFTSEVVMSSTVFSFLLLFTFFSPYFDTFIFSVTFYLPSFIKLCSPQFIEM